LLFSTLEDRITSKNQRFFPVIPGRGTDIVCNARITCGIFYAFVAFPKQSFGAQGLPAVIPGRGTDIVCNARITCGIFYAFVAFPKQSFGAQKGIKNAPKREHCKRCREDGIRTHDAVAHIQTFQACSFNHSDTSLGNCGCK
jgi:hypothetical protein